MSPDRPRRLELPAWPGGARVGLSFTVDVDAESLWLGMDGRDYRDHLSRISAAQFSVVRGLQRLTAVLRRFEIPATFYVPGVIVERYPEEIKALLDEGHDLQHHGYLHRRPDRLDPGEQREEIDRGLEAFDRELGVRPRGYRAPWWELMTPTADLLIERGFLFDSSCMGDDRPYLQPIGEHALLELPVHWSLDDGQFFQWGAEGWGGHPYPPGSLVEVWLAEVEAAAAERRHVTFTVEPGIVGRAHRMQLIERFLEATHERFAPWFATHAQLASLLAP